MRLLIVRHAPAGDKTAFARTGRPDSTRPLTVKGRRKMEKAAPGLRAAMPKIDLLASSPLARALQTAEVVGAAYGLGYEVVPALAPGVHPREALHWLQSRREDTVAVVGHEPSLGGLITWLLTGKDGSLTTLKKGGACLLEFKGKPEAGKATLLWSLAPAHLRRLR